MRLDKEKELSQRENERDLGRIDDTNYVAQKREIERRDDFKRDNTWRTSG